MISTTVLITVGIQVYRNVQNYKINKQRFINDVQQALDFSVEAYYADMARNDIIVLSNSSPFRAIGSTMFGDTIGYHEWELDSATHRQSHMPQLMLQSAFEAVRVNPKPNFSFSSTTTKLNGRTIDSIRNISGTTIAGIGIQGEPWPEDSLGAIDAFVRRVTFSLTRDTMDFVKLDSFLIDELNRKSINVGHAIWHYADDTVLTSDNKTYALSTTSKSTYLPPDEELLVKFNNASLIVLKRGMLDLLISLIISGAVIGSLLYLYRVITEQKELAEIKNDLISNITHEFKTPIATVSTAIEAISNFNQAKDPVKTAKYLDISSNQLQKLNGMVEKLLETASLDSDELELSLESVEVVKFTQQIFEKFHLIKGGKKLSFQTEISEQRKQIDPFHMENAISNLIDNAIKYGGNEISLKLAENGEKLKWQVIDNGGKIDKQQQQRIFDQFYRVPTGNVHDVKGFGIGLYYTKKIVEKHEGTISLSVATNKTDFTIAI